MKKICAITMARNDNFFLKKWIEYYVVQLGRENLYILLDGFDQSPPKNSDGINVQNVERKPHLSQNGKDRAKRLSNLAKELLEKYDIVICNDADEFLVVDPKVSSSLKEYLSKIDINTSISGLGIDVGHDTKSEKDLINSDNFLKQRSKGLVSPRYTKPVAITKPIKWGAGIHRIKGKNFHIDDNLFLFHFGLADKKRLEDKFNGELSSLGWSSHIKRQFKLMQTIEDAKAKDFDSKTPIARCIQRYLRPPYAFNKPSMWFYKLVIKIPSRFENIL